MPVSYTAKGGKLLLKVASKADDLKRGIGVTLDSYSSLKKLFKGIKGVEIHHLIEKRFARFLGINQSKILSIPLTKSAHRVFTDRWRKVIPYGKKLKNLDELKYAIFNVYGDVPDVYSKIIQWLYEVLR